MAFQENVIGVKDLTDNLKNIASIVGGAEFADSLEKGAMEIVWQAKQNVMAQGLHETGELWNSIKPVKVNQFTVAIRVNVDYGAAMEFGQVQIVTEKQRRFFWAKLAETGDEMWKAMALSARLETPARPYLRPAVDEMKNQAIITTAQSLGGKFSHVVK